MPFSDTYLFRAQHSYLNEYDLATGEVTRLAAFDRVIEAPFYAKDGRSIFYNSEGRIYRFDLETKCAQLVGTGDCIYCNNDHVLSPDGREIAISGNTDSEGMSKIYRVKLGTDREEEIVSHPLSYLHGWSPDGTTLAYCAARRYGDELEWDIYTCPAFGGEETRLTSAPGLNDGPEYSPDGGTIWFNSVRTGLMQVWKMNADGSGQTQMTFDGDWNSWFPHISPDNRNVVYLAYRKEDLAPGDHVPDKHVQLRLIPAAGGKPVTLVELFGGQGTINVNSWAPDGTKFAFVSYSKNPD